MVVALSPLPSIATLSIWTRTLGKANAHACFIASRWSQSPPPLLRSVEEAATPAGGVGLLRKVENVLLQELGFPTWMRISSSFSIIAWEIAYWSAAADSRVGSATTITFLFGTVPPFMAMNCSSNYSHLPPDLQPVAPLPSMEEGFGIQGQNSRIWGWHFVF